MKVVITYDNGRVDVFDDGRFTAAQPFGSNAMLANYELRFDRLGQTGLWLCIHHYDISPGAAQLDSQEGTPRASRSRGWQFLLAEKEEVSHVVQIKADERELAFRVGGELVDAAKFKQMVDLCISDASQKSKAQCAVELFGILSRMPGASVAAPEEICSRFGFGLGAYDEALAISASPPGSFGERHPGKEDGTQDVGCEWMKGLDDEVPD
ncbi:MAG: hypothetical protein KH015_14070 [Gordonibacter pamelaeae]|uniref:Uncharacterized protein n=1 Tax=Gordonibacter pamelaeae TaxID=471189 RepID=A0A369M9E2_9ACTN|nr:MULTISPECIES: hypothetical protein [Coriobacteriia]HJH73370.1 hypothetical protein [Eggerthellaceae bacterium]MBS4896881.1 hypothetical protein [Gordonibacter pamelaeae]MCB6560407.1 hypothetical protein [Gordonibacter urolithinfaciens]MCQ4847054.1 hypothetical protein [Gordonibacter pamelaeae]MCQ4849263.1 hypothetical protein [Gordonibacter pamelaeae]